MDISIHDVSNIQVTPTERMTRSGDIEFYTRDLIITDIHGNVTRINLFNDTSGMLKIITEI